MGDTGRPPLRRASITAECPDYSPDEWEFAAAMDAYKRRTGNRFPAWSEVLAVAKSLGWRKVAEPDEGA